MRPRNQSCHKKTKVKARQIDVLIIVKITDAGEAMVQEESFKIGNSFQTFKTLEETNDLEVLSNTPLKERCVNQFNRWVHRSTSSIIIIVEDALDRPIVTDLCNNMHQGNTKEEILHTKSPIQTISSNNIRCHVIRKPFTDTHKPHTLCRHRSSFSTRKIILMKTNSKDLNLILGR